MMNHWCFWAGFVFIVLPTCVKAFRARFDTMYVMNPDGEILLAIRRRPEHWCINFFKSGVGRITNSTIFQKVKSRRHDSLHALDHSLFCYLVCINFVRVVHVDLCLPTATSILDSFRQLSYVFKLVHSSTHDIEPFDHILWNLDTFRVGIQSVRLYEKNFLGCSACSAGRQPCSCLRGLSTQPRNFKPRFSSRFF